MRLGMPEMSGFSKTRWPRSAAVQNEGLRREDPIQFHSAIHAAADCLITRDGDHFPATDLPVISPAAFLALLPSE